MSGYAEDKENSWAYWPQVPRQIQTAQNYVEKQSEEKAWRRKG